MTTSLRQQLRDAYLASGLTLLQVKKRCRLRMSRISLGRKLAGTQALRTEEAEAIAWGLGVRIWTGREARPS